MSPSWRQSDVLDPTLVAAVALGRADWALAAARAAAQRALALPIHGRKMAVVSLENVRRTLLKNVLDGEKTLGRYVGCLWKKFCEVMIEET